MGDEALSYYEPVPGIYGTPTPRGLGAPVLTSIEAGVEEISLNWVAGVFGSDSDPESRAALQNASAQLQFTLTTAPGYVPPNYIHPGSGSLPIIGWTAQNGYGTAAFHPYNPHVGTTPDWTADANSAGAGRYDQTQVVAYGDYNPLNRGPLGSPFYDAPGAQEPENPNTLPQDVSGTSGQDLEY